MGFLLVSGEEAISSISVIDEFFSNHIDFAQNSLGLMSQRKREIQRGQQQNLNNLCPKKEKERNFTCWRINGVCLSQQLVFWVSKLSQGKGALLSR